MIFTFIVSGVDSILQLNKTITTEVMNDNTNIFESLLENAVDYSKTGYELVKLKTLDKTANVLSSLISHYVTLILFASFILFISVGLAYWLGEILGKIYFGFFAVALFYAVTGTVLHFALHTKLKRIVGDYLNKKLLK